MAYNHLILFIISLYSSVCFGELRDPTKPASYIPNRESVYTLSNELKLTAIWSSAHSKRATINGVTAKPGETILSGIKIVNIYTGSVLIEQNGIRKKLYLLTRQHKAR